MPVGPKTAAFIANMPKGIGAEATLAQKGIERFRMETEAFFDAHAMPIAADVTVNESAIPTPDGHKLNIKVYKPDDAGPDGEMPMLVYFPGGASVLDLKKAYDGPCSEMAKQMGGVVVKVSCRLAPEFKRDKAFEDAYVATCYLYQNAHQYGCSQDRFTVGGNSSGSHLAALVVNESRQNTNLNISAQLLITPSVDMSLTLRTKTPYLAFQEEDRLLTTVDQAFYTKISMPEGADPQDPALSPYYNNLEGVPPTIIIVGEYDGIRGDAEAYAEKLKEAGVPLIMHRIPEQVHSAMIFYKLLNDGPYQATIAGDALGKMLKQSNVPSVLPTSGRRLGAAKPAVRTTAEEAGSNPTGAEPKRPASGS